jgi:hypothetical protein
MREVFAAGISFFVFIENIGFFGGFVPAIIISLGSEAVKEPSLSI